MEKFIKNHLKLIQPLNKKAALSYWNAAITGDDVLYEQVSEYELEIRKIYSCKDDFEILKKYKDENKLDDPLIIRQLEMLYNQYLENQIDTKLLEEMVMLGTEIEKIFSKFRAKVGNKELTSNEIDEILKNETDNNVRKQTWEAGKSVAAQVSDKLIKLAEFRNNAAQNLGFDNFHSMSLLLDEQNPEEIDTIFNQLYELTNKPFQEEKLKLDENLANLYKVNISKIQPWHYHDLFFQEIPAVYETNYDKYYMNSEIIKVAEKFYKSIGFSVKSILKNSDLYEKPGKNPHAFCTDIDRNGDVRILCNIKNTERWMETTLHELGHAIYDKYHNKKTPYLLREPAHIFTTEAIAMLFGRLSRNGYWMEEMLKLPKGTGHKVNDLNKNHSKFKQLIFIRWALVMYNFEKQFYKNPRQNLNKLWWDLVEKYQFIKKPKDRNFPDWAAKIHFTIAPCYYHNYVLGELLASQLHHTIINKVLELPDEESFGYANCSQIGEYLKQNIFKQGAIFNWNEMIKKATGEYLNPDYFIKQFVNS